MLHFSTLDDRRIERSKIAKMGWETRGQMARLNNNQWKKLFVMYEDDGIPVASLAQQFGVTESAVYQGLKRVKKEMQAIPLEEVVTILRRVWPRLPQHEREETMAHIARHLVGPEGKI